MRTSDWGQRQREQQDQWLNCHPNTLQDNQSKQSLNIINHFEKKAKMKQREIERERKIKKEKEKEE